MLLILRVTWMGPATFRGMKERRGEGSKYFNLVIGDWLLGLEVEIVAKLLPRLQDARRHGTQRPARRWRQRTCGIHHLLLDLFFNSMFLFEASCPKEISGDGRLILRDTPSRSPCDIHSLWCTINTLSAPFVLCLLARRTL